MDEHIVESYLTLIPSELNHDVGALIRRKMREKWVDKCFREYGYVMDIMNIQPISSIYISRTNQDLIVHVRATIVSIIPKHDQSFSGRVHAIYPEGIFLILMETFYALLPLSVLVDMDYTYSVNTNQFVQHGADGYTAIDTNKYISVLVTDVHYDNNTFNCICKLNTNSDDMK